MKLHFLPDEILLLLLEYLRQKEKYELVCCRQHWYRAWMKRIIRKITIDGWKYCRNYQELLRRVKILIVNPYEQLDLLQYSSEYHLEAGFILFLYQMGAVVHILTADDMLFVIIMKFLRKLRMQLRVKELQVKLVEEVHVHGLHGINESLLQLVDCQSLTLSYYDHMVLSTFPHIPTLRKLSLCNAEVCPAALKAYFTHLHHLTLDNCTIVDVTMLGSIPFLELVNCQKLKDISPLNDNDHIIVKDCIEVTDYSRSFANSRIIDIRLQLVDKCRFDLSRWCRVEDLSLRTFMGCKSIHFHNNNNHLPVTVKRCYLNKSFVSKVDYTVTPQHTLRDLRLLSDHKITSLAGYGLENVSVLELYELSSLESLQGLGPGKMKKITVTQCPKITDFSPLNHISMVEITHCDGFRDPSQILSVKDLTIFIRKDSKALPSITLSAFEGLVRLPTLRLNYHSLTRFRELLEEGERFQNQTIMIYSFDRHEDEDLEAFYDQFLRDSYDRHENMVPWKWVLTRREKKH